MTFPSCSSFRTCFGICQFKRDLSSFVVEMTILLTFMHFFSFSHSRIILPFQTILPNENLPFLQVPCISFPPHFRVLHDNLTSIDAFGREDCYLYLSFLHSHFNFIKIKIQDTRSKTRKFQVPCFSFRKINSEFKKMGQ